MMNCLRCSAEMRSTGVHQFRTGGTTGGWKLLFHEWAELGEEMMALDVWYCPECGKVEFFLPQR